MLALYIRNEVAVGWSRDTMSLMPRAWRGVWLERFQPESFLQAFLEGTKVRNLHHFPSFDIPNMPSFSLALFALLAAPFLPFASADSLANPYPTVWPGNGTLTPDELDTLMADPQILAMADDPAIHPIPLDRRRKSYVVEPMTVEEIDSYKLFTHIARVTDCQKQFIMPWDCGGELRVPVLVPWCSD